MKRGGFTLVEAAVALGIAGMIVVGSLAAMRFFTRPAGQADVTLDQLAALSLGAESLDRDLRQARQIIWPEPNAAPARALYVRDFDGTLYAYYFDPNKRQLRRARFSLTGLVSDASPRATDLDGALFSVNANGLVSWALYAPGRMLIGSVRRVNQ